MLIVIMGGLTLERGHDGDMMARVLRETHGTDVLVSLLEDFEYTHMQIEHLFATCREHDIEVIHFPIVGESDSIPTHTHTHTHNNRTRTTAHASVTHVPLSADGETPVSLEDTHAVVSKMQAHLEAGRNVVVHCKAGLGRTGTTLRHAPVPPHSHRTRARPSHLPTARTSANVN
jgi:protein tyrosine phosphatase